MVYISDNMFFYVDDSGNEVSIHFGDGIFDQYCVYAKDTATSKKYAMKDKDYFQWILDLSEQYGINQVWNDFCSIYDIISMDSDAVPDVKLAESIIDDINVHYNEDTKKWWIVFYMTMIAECKKKNAKLKKRIKKLGVYNILFDEYSIEYTTTYMVKPEGAEDWADYLDGLMKERNI